MTYALIHDEYKNNQEVDEVLYLVKYINGNSGDKKVISSELHYIKPRHMLIYARGLAREAWNNIMMELNTYGIEAARELLEYEANHQLQLSKDMEK